MKELSAVKKAARGDRQALGMLFEQYRGYVYAIAWKITMNNEDALDVTQEVFEKLMESIQTYKGEGAFRSWIGSVTARTAISLTRKSQRNHETAVEPKILQDQRRDEVQNRFPHPVKALEKKERIAMVEDAVRTLTPQQRAVFLMRFKLDLSTMEIAKNLYIPPGQVRSQLSQAVSRLRDKFSNENVKFIRKEG